MRKKGLEIEFTKMHGLGNDFILIDTIAQPEVGSLNNSELSALSQKLCQRRFGIGADQMLLLCPSEKADFRMRIFNADGSEVQMCGNGIRCLAKYIWSRRISNKNPLKIETPAGIIRPEKDGRNIKVNMGCPRFKPNEIPIDVEKRLKEIIDYPLNVGGREFSISCVSMGNPHAVIFVDSTDTFPVAHYGPLIENHTVFPERTNVEFVEVLNKREIKMRVWERGAGETLACGTGASAAAVITTYKGITNKKVKVHLLGGDLWVEWAENGEVNISGPAEEVYYGTIKTGTLRTARQKRSSEKGS
jgi:diaminopimelate epimerase